MMDDCAHDRIPVLLLCGEFLSDVKDVTSAMDFRGSNEKEREDALQPVIEKHGQTIMDRIAEFGQFFSFRLSTEDSCLNAAHWLTGYSVDMCKAFIKTGFLQSLFHKLIRDFEFVHVS